MLKNNIVLKLILKPSNAFKYICSALLCFLCDRLFRCVTINYKQFSQFYIGCQKCKKKATMYIAAYMKFENKIRTD